VLLGLQGPWLLGLRLDRDDRGEQALLGDAQSHRPLSARGLSVPDD